MEFSAPVACYCTANLILGSDWRQQILPCSNQILYCFLLCFESVSNKEPMLDETLRKINEVSQVHRIDNDVGPSYQERHPRRNKIMLARSEFSLHYQHTKISSAQDLLHDRPPITD